MATNQKVDKDEDTASIADSALGTASVSGATFTGTQFSEVSCSIQTMIAENTNSAHVMIWLLKVHPP